MADFGGAAGFGDRPAVVVVDLNYGFTDPASPLACDLDDVLVSCRSLLDVARDARVPVYFTTIVYDDVWEAAAAVFLRKVPALKVLRPGTRWVEIDERLGRREDEPVIVKQYASAFFGTSLASTLTASGSDSVVLTGLTTSGCVRATAVDAMQHGFIPLVVEEAVGDRDERPHRASLFDLDAKYADVVHEDEVLTYLRALGDVTHPGPVPGPQLTPTVGHGAGRAVEQ